MASVPYAVLGVTNKIAANNIIAGLQLTEIVFVLIKSRDDCHKLVIIVMIKCIGFLFVISSTYSSGLESFFQSVTNLSL